MFVFSVECWIWFFLLIFSFFFFRRRPLGVTEHLTTSHPLLSILLCHTKPSAFPPHDLANRLFSSCCDPFVSPSSPPCLHPLLHFSLPLSITLNCWRQEFKLIHLYCTFLIFSTFLLCSITNLSYKDSLQIQKLKWAICILLRKKSCFGGKKLNSNIFFIKFIK